MTALLKYFSSMVSISILLIAGLYSDDMSNTKDLAEFKDSERHKVSRDDN